MPQVMASVRHLYKDDVKNAPRLNAEPKKNYTPYKSGKKLADDASGLAWQKQRPINEKRIIVG